MMTTMALSKVLLCFILAIGSTASELQDHMQECTLSLAPLTHGSLKQKPSTSGKIIQYSCNHGYRLVGNDTRTCINGTWSPPLPPVCRKYDEALCAADLQIMHGQIRLHPENSEYHRVTKGTTATVICDPGYSTYDTLEVQFVIECGSYGMWNTSEGPSDLNRCTRKRCASPPEVPWAIFHYKTGEEMQVKYTCSEGYELLGQDATLTCRNGQWDGPAPTCELKTFCNAPAKIRNGKWEVLSGTKLQGSYEGGEIDAVYSKFHVGTKLSYSCSPGYKLEGPRILQCIIAQIWSRAPPICIPENENILYCPHFEAIKHGFCKCMGQDTADLQLCMPFHHGTRIECTCLLGYALQGVSVLTCTRNPDLNMGGWDWDVPTCIKRYPSDSDGENDIGMLPDGQGDGRGKGYNSGDIRDSKTKVSSLVIVVTTACSVLGILLLIMVVVIFRRKKSRTAIFQQVTTPPPYARVHNTVMDEHDRLALMAYADASRIHLPSYEEAMQPGGRLGGHIAGGSRGASIMDRSVSPTTSEYQRLPNVLIRSNMHHPNMGGDGNNNINNNNNNNANSSNRHSTITTSTMNRDGLSEIFGSVDTVNVSMSDASTAVTVETFDSGTSNRSMVSQRGTAGSLNSSEDHLANDDAPLLETTLQREVDVVSLSSNPSRTSKDD